MSSSIDDKNSKEYELKRVEVLANLHIKVIVMLSIGFTIISPYLLQKTKESVGTEFENIVFYLFLVVEAFMLCGIFLHGYRLRKNIKYLGGYDDKPC